MGLIIRVPIFRTQLTKWANSTITLFIDACFLDTPSNLYATNFLIENVFYYLFYSSSHRAELCI